MKTRITPLLIFISVPFFFFGTSMKNNWIDEKHESYKLSYTLVDRENIKEYVILIEDGKKTVNDFFQNDFKNDFNIYIHPNRLSLDTTWQKDWGIPDFKSQCWMVASGVADQFDLISPKSWHIEACEHNYSNKIKTQQLITHELIHVYHGQLNQSSDFSNVNGIDWFIEGLATYASGQCDSLRISEVKSAIIEEKIPKNLNEFWSGKRRYGLSATLVMYIDEKYGREKLIEILIYNDINDILHSLNATESEIVSGWMNFLKSYKVSR